MRPDPDAHLATADQEGVVWNGGATVHSTCPWQDVAVRAQLADPARLASGEAPVQSSHWDTALQTRPCAKLPDPAPGL